MDKKIIDKERKEVGDDFLAYLRYITVKKDLEKKLQELDKKYKLTTCFDAMMFEMDDYRYLTNVFLGNSEIFD